VRGDYRRIELRLADGEDEILHLAAVHRSDVGRKGAARASRQAFPTTNHTGYLLDESVEDANGDRKKAGSGSGPG
jgi:hypothetical protein